MVLSLGVLRFLQGPHEDLSQCPRGVSWDCLRVFSWFSQGRSRDALGCSWGPLRSCPTFVVGRARSSWGSFRMPPRVLSGCPGIVLGISQAFPRATLRVPSDFPSALSGFAQGHGQASLGLSEVSSEDVSQAFLWVSQAFSGFSEDFPMALSGCRKRIS